MHIIFTAEELQWINKKPFNWTIKKGCPDSIKKGLQKKLDALKPENYKGTEAKNGKNRRQQ